MFGQEAGLSASELRGASVEQAFELVSGVVMGVNESYPHLGTVQRYQLIADFLPGKIENELQQRLLTAVHRGRRERREQAEYTFLMLNLKTVLTTAEEYFNGDPERDADVLEAGILRLVERLPTLDPQVYPVTTYIYAVVVSGVADFLGQNEGMSYSLVRRGVSREVERAVDRLLERYPWGVRRERREGFARKLVEKFGWSSDYSSGRQAIAAYLKRRNESLPDPEVTASGAEAEVYKLLMQEDVRAAMASLPDEDQTVLWLRYWKGLTLDETAEKLGTTRDKVRRIEAIALRRLRSPSRLRGFRDWWQD